MVDARDCGSELIGDSRPDLRGADQWRHPGTLVSLMHQLSLKDRLGSSSGRGSGASSRDRTAVSRVPAGLAGRPRRCTDSGRLALEEWPYWPLTCRVSPPSRSAVTCRRLPGGVAAMALGVAEGEPSLQVTGQQPTEPCVIHGGSRTLHMCRPRMARGATVASS